MARESTGLTDLVAALRSEIDRAQTKLAEQGKEAMFNLDHVEAEVHFVIEKGAGGGGGFNIHFVAVEAKGNYKSQNVHKLKISLTPVGPTAFARPPAPPE